MQTIELLKYLSKKLQTGNTRSIHLNALPGRYATRLDLANLNIIDLLTNNKLEGTSGFSFIETLLTKSDFSFTLSFDKINLSKTDENQQKQLTVIAKKLNAIFYENNDTFLEHGIKTFGFGYPLLIKRDKKDTSKVIKAPLFIWQLEIEKSNKSQNTWTIKRGDDFGISINEVLISHINNDEEIKIDTITPDILEDCLLDKNELLSLCDTILNQLNSNISPNNLELELVECPSKERTENLTNNTSWISWAGIFGLFRSQKQSIIKDIDLLINQFATFKFDDLVIEKYQSSTISSVPTDPSQELIINSLKTNPKLIIQGPPGTGKSQSLTAIITNAIENGAKCLIVCEKKTALDVIYNNLQKIGLDKLCTIIDDISKDRKRVIDLVRNAINEKYYSVNFKEQEYQNQIKLFEHFKANINYKHNKICKIIFGDLTWKDIIGKCLKYSNDTNCLLIKPIFDTSFLKFDFQEYSELQRIIKKASSLYCPITNENNYLDLLNRNIFKSDFLLSTKNDIENDLIDLTQQAKLLIINIQEYFKTIDYLNTNHKFAKKLPKFWVNILPFSKEVKSKRQEFDILQNKIASNYENLILNHNNHNHFNSNYFNIRILDENSLAILEQNLSSYNKVIECITSQFDNFRVYFEWYSFLQSLKSEFQFIINELIKAQSKNWNISFDYWYLNQVLLKFEKELGVFHTNDKEINELALVNEQLKLMQKNKIVHYWETKQGNAIYNFKKGNLLSLYNYRKNKQHESKNSLRKIINTDFDLFSTFFPVLLINPVVCSSIIPLKEGIFDIVIFDEASQLRLEDTFAAMFRGKYKIVSGDKHQMPPSNYFHSDIKLNYSDKEIEEDDENEINDSIDLADSESLLKYAEDSGFKYSYLDFHYRSRHPYLIDFSNAAFYGSRLVPMPAKKHYKPIHFFNVNGLYSNSTNATEVKEVLRILFIEIKPFENGEYPSVGIATLNLYQRNLILDEIQIECYKNPQSAAVFEQITKSGFFVKNLENIQGDEKDIIIISTTFGLNSDNKFRQNFGPLNQDKGYRLLNVIITRAKHHLFVVTSIPQLYYSRFREDIETRGNVGKGIFYAYLAYAESVEKEDDMVRSGILKSLSNHCAEPSKIVMEDFVESPFEQAVYELLCENIDKNRIFLQYQCGGFRIDFVIKSKTGKLIALECDGAKYHSSEVAYSYDIYRQKQLENLDFAFYRIWSTNFWYNPKTEINKLIQFIDSVDKINGNSVSNINLQNIQDKTEQIQFEQNKTQQSQFDQLSFWEK